jgi:8-oxo-dGTP diphosphatase
MTEHSAPPTLTQVAVGIVHNAAGQVLFAQRPAGKPYAGWWEFPGGKIETGETVALALARELREELGIQILDCHPWLTQRYVYPHAHVNLQFCHVQAFSGQPQSLEGQAFAWGTPESPPLPFLPAALPVLKAMQLPAVLRFSAQAGQDFAAWQARLQALPAGTVIVNEPQASEAAARAVLGACLAWQAAKPSERRILVASCHPPAWWGLADGVHLLEPDLMALATSSKPRLSYVWVGASASSAPAMQAGAALGCNYLTVNATAGWGALGEALAACQVASYAVGEAGHSAGLLAEQHLPLAQAAGAAGIAIAL